MHLPLVERFAACHGRCTSSASIYVLSESNGMTKKPVMMGISIYRGQTLLGKAIDLAVEGSVVTIGLGVIDRFEVLRYLSPRVARDLIGEKAITDMPPLTLYCEGSSIKTKKKVGEGISRITFKPEIIEVNPMPGQNLTLKSFKGTLVGNIESGVEVPDTAVPTVTASSTEPTVLY